MVARIAGKSLILPLAPLAAALLGTAAAAGVALAPAQPLEALVSDSGLSGLIAAAQPPLGATARALLALGVGGLIALFGGLAMFMLVGGRKIALGRRVEDDGIVTPTVRRADRHPDAPPRPPLLATRDLGTPFLEVTAARHRSAEDAEPEVQPEAAVAEVEEVAVLDIAAPLPITPAPAELPVFRDPATPLAITPTPAEQPQVVDAERPLPADLDQPLAAFDPQAIPEVPLPPPSLARVPVKRRNATQTYAPGERFEVYELAPPVPVNPRDPEPVRSVPSPVEVRLGESVLAATVEPPVEPIAAPETDATIHALLDRLERGVARRGIAPTSTPAPRRSANEHGLEEALATLRKMAMRA